ncbi:MAG: branched-chain amino acid ABC transporter permease [Deltaproteobacteria bacterium]|jgi:branched-chain amino acid transport system permease protein|nr:branched-chain amino acid ABC transporter permease [Deltaproteobacteria bacterium]
MRLGRLKLARSVEILGTGLFLALPFILSALNVRSSPYILDLLSMVGLYALLSLSLNVILGLAGMFHMGHAAFFAVGAYVTANLNLTYGWSILATLPAAALGAGLLALAVAIPVIRLRGDYLLIVTIGIVEIVKIALTNDVFGLTGGPNGLIGIARPMVFGYRVARPVDFFYLIWIMVAFSALLFHWLENSRFGRALKYIKEDAVAAEGMGVDATAYKLMAFVIGAAWAGMAGTIFAAKMRTISPESFTFGESVVMFTIVILGGSGNQKGVVLGSFLVMGLPELFRDFQDLRLLAYGAALVAMMIFRPQGLWPPKPTQYRLPPPYDEKYPAGGSG